MHVIQAHVRPHEAELVILIRFMQWRLGTRIASSPGHCLPPSPPPPPPPSHVTWERGSDKNSYFALKDYHNVMCLQLLRVRCWAVSHNEAAKHQLMQALNPCSRQHNCCWALVVFGQHGVVTVGMWHHRQELPGERLLTACLVCGKQLLPLAKTTPLVHM